MLQRSFSKGCEPLWVVARDWVSGRPGILANITGDWLWLPTGHRFIPGKQTSIYFFYSE